MNSICRDCDTEFKQKYAKRPSFYCSKLCRWRYLNKNYKRSPNSWRFLVLKKSNFGCHYCGKSPKDDGVKLEIDHITPRSKGGANHPDNYVAACFECNRGKRDTEL